MASPDTSGTPTPADSQIIKNIGVDQSPAMTFAKGGNQPLAAPDFAAIDEAKRNADIEASYQPLIDNLTKQRADAIQRTAQNAADIKNIFGTLSTIRQQDAMKIADQFKASLLQQQAALAGRTAEARTGLAANQQGVATAAGELGGGPQGAPADSLTAQAVNQGIAGANQYQTVWEGLQGAMQGQTQQNLQNAISGYGYQQAAAVQDLQRSLNQSLQQIDAQKAQVDSSIGQAKLQAKQALAEMQAEASMKQAELQNAQDVAGITAKSRTDVAKINAAAKLAAKKTSGNDSAGSTDAFTTWAKNIDKNSKQYGGTTSSIIMSSVNDIVTAITAARNKTANGKNVKTPTAQEIFSTWMNHHPNNPYTNLYRDYIYNYYSK